MTNQEILEAVSFPVGLRQVNYVDDKGDSHQIPDKQAVVRTDTGEALSVVSDQYKLIPYGEVIDPLLNTMRKYCGTLTQRASGVRKDPIRIEQNGKRIWLETTFNHQITIDKDVILPRVVYGNSYDCTSAFRMITGFYQVKCTNAGALIKPGKLHGFGGGEFSRKHKGRGEEIPFNHVEDHLKKFLDDFGLMTTSLQSLANTTVPLDKAKDIFTKYCGKRYSEKNELAPESAWAFYARITNYTTMDFKGGQRPAERRVDLALREILKEAK